ncbi:MAG: hypothetical protein WA417_22325 [Stellaceae bacterium]
MRIEAIGEIHLAGHHAAEDVEILIRRPQLPGRRAGLGALCRGASTLRPSPHAAYVGLRLQPSLSYFASPWPIDTIWQANKEGEVPPVDLASGGTSLEIRRSGEAVAWRRLDPGIFAFRTALADGLVLAAAMAAATLRDPTFDLTSALQQAFAEGLAVAFCISPEPGDPTMIARSTALDDPALRLHHAIALLDRFPPSLLQLKFRVAIAAVFWSSGLIKPPVGTPPSCCSATSTWCRCCRPRSPR